MKDLLASDDDEDSSKVEKAYVPKLTGKKSEAQGDSPYSEASLTDVQWDLPLGKHACLQLESPYWLQSSLVKP